MFCIVVAKVLHDPAGHYAFRIGQAAPFSEPILFDKLEDANKALKLWNSSLLWSFRVAKVDKKLCQKLRKKTDQSRYGMAAFASFAKWRI